MKSHEGELVREISKLQAMVLELRSGFSRALLELNQIQLGDTELQNQLEETRHGCNKRTLHLETLVLTLKEELEEIRCQIRQLCDEQVKSEQTNSNTGAQSDSAPGCSGVKDVSSTNGIKNGNEVTVAPPLCTAGGALLLHCYLQGLWAGHNSGESSSHVSLRGEGASSCTQTGRRQRVSISLLKSEWDYFSKLNLLQEKYRTPSSNHTETHKVFVRHVDEMLQRHLLFRNSLQEKLSGDEQNRALGDAFLKLTTQDNSAFCDAYLGYTAALATILTTEFSRDPTDKPHNTQEEGEKFRLLSLLLAPVTRLHTYLNTVQVLLSCSSSEHSDWRSLHNTNQVLRNLYTRCHMTLERAGRWTDGAGRPNEGAESANGLSSRCCSESPECARSAFTKYRANGHQREPHYLTVPRPLLTPAGILRNSRERVCEPPPPAGWTESCVWDFRAVECRPVPARRPQNLFLNPGAPGELPGSIPTLKSPSGLAERLCGSPGPDGRVCRSDACALPQRIDDADTDADVGDASVFDYSSVTTCSPDDTLELRGRDEDEEDDEEEDSEIPVLLKPSYTHTHTHSGGGSQREGSVCTRWQIPRAAPLPPEVCVAGSGTGRRPANHRRKIPTRAFRPIWDAPFKQGDGAPAKENTVSFSSTDQIINPQRPTDSSRSVYRSVCGGERDGLWNDSDDSEGPCSNV
ncbi:uncharacterized protein LOC113542073 [Pangasianodon hypophthalmus]|uniref:uncharacterized protein LOC113542073 n=1 Tax=Pangasianodon hypophthalmus TaxID=310915 RepID=UPI000F007272|nr:uncharacterized protein LOC113542073 [Pangasianodon hypophthalmus]XP_053088915.1 uncharacterized protein LOC113542073 [Pangasianodon hypophthalmus]XP_053088916.1 uncharacterized protein LOC113542073 [Pangasianodon hypophthalmus]XP_053088917.1 uncharacterized protein LOC113542073 [Pangasianodon hypophthalmus]XP_053088918.1 uncharacterized protein LOC113542073 [Pangasianodon hypophthalmus]